ncbi:MAG: DNA polymerase III subunit delta' [Sedimentisphaerales bacterium]|nr:DNA polymerase III subunit delta' [Sedimentisphaerales bacterium]
MSLKDVFCQDKAVSLLQRVFCAGRIPHAYIFAGPDGVGKFKTALEWARLLLCKDPLVKNGVETADSCGTCQSCRAVEGNCHPDFNVIHKELVEFTKDGKDKKTPVDLPIAVIREFLVDKVCTRPTLSQRKVYIVSEAEKLNTASQNSLLKVLEEPPGYCCIILLCTRLDRLLPTTRSRCQIVRFGPVDEEKIFERLSQTGLGRDQAVYFSRLSQGSIGLACRWAQLEQTDAGLYALKTNLLDSVAKLKFENVPDVAADLLDKSKAIAKAWSELENDTSKKDIDRMASKSLVGMVIAALHDAMKLNVKPEDEAVNFDQKKRIEELAGRFTAQELAEKISGCYEILRWIEAGVNEKLVFEQLLFNLAESDRMTV